MLLSALPTDLSEGRYAAPGWVILALGVGVALVATVLLVVRVRKSREKR